jgi:bacteriorhodopsin
MKNCYVKNSFYFTYIFLITTGTITFIESLRNPIPQIRHVMNLETCISIVAGYFYGLFIKEIESAENETKLKTKSTNERNEHTVQEESILPIKKINDMRYSDWAITTPLMLLVLSLVLSYENKVAIKLSSLFALLVFDFLMLIPGYLGEIGTISRASGTIAGYVGFFLLFGTLWRTYMSGSKVTNQSKIVFGIYFVLWTLYGIAYQANESTKMLSYNILDLFAKAFVGIFFWLYLAKIIKT